MAVDYESAILYWVLIGLDVWGHDLASRGVSARWAKETGDGPASQLRHHGVRYEPAMWAKYDAAPPPTVAARKAYSRAVLSLEELRLVVAVRSSGRTTHLQLTPRGVAVGLRLHRDIRPKDVAAALKAAKWAGKQHVAAIKVTHNG
jgi:hypothetical protein